MECTYFLHAGTASGKLKVISLIFGWAWSKIGVAIDFMKPKNLVFCKNKFMNWADFLNADNDTILFGKTDILLFDFQMQGSTAVVLFCF